jgi:hypothetical protein
MAKKVAAKVSKKATAAKAKAAKATKAASNKAFARKMAKDTPFKGKGFGKGWAEEQGTSGEG